MVLGYRVHPLHVGTQARAKERYSRAASQRGVRTTVGETVTRATEPANAIMARSLTEAAFLRQVVDLAHYTGWLVHHCRPAVLPSGKWATHIQGDPGFPDLVLAKEGRVIFVELKREKGRVTDAQQAWRWALGAGRYGCSAFVWRPSDWSVIEKVLKGEEHEIRI